MKYQKGDHVKIEATDEKSGDREWMWLLVRSSDDQRQLVFGQLDSEPCRGNRHESAYCIR